jgi:putative transcriptional regulator
MHRFRAIRLKLGVSQLSVAQALGCAQSNVSYYERGQTIPPDVARKLIDYAVGLGMPLTFDLIYGDAPLPARRVNRETTA